MENVDWGARVRVVESVTKGLLVGMLGIRTNRVLDSILA